MADEPSAEALPIWAVNRATEIASTFEYALNVWERDAIAREIDAAYRRDAAVIAASRAVLAQYEPHEIVDAEATLRDALAEYDRSIARPQERSP